MTSDPTELPILIVTVRCPTAVLDDVDFRASYMCEPLARAMARRDHPGHTVRYANVYQRLPAPDEPGSEDAVTHWTLVPVSAEPPRERK
ncbi:MAG: hypothetical protein WCI67_20735 [Chloroflexales bacterium]